MPTDETISLRTLPDGYRAVVVGATGAIGAAFADLLACDPRCGSVVSLSRSGDPPVDICDEAQVAAAAKRLEGDGPLHLVVDATGVLHGEGVTPEKSLRQIDPDALLRVFAVNAVGPALLLKHFGGLLDREEKAVFATLSARVGSIGDNHLGGWYGYRSSKAALNMIVRSAAIEIARRRRHAVVVALHPGTVVSSLSEPFSGSRERYTPHESVRMMLQVVDGLSADSSGSFYAYDGTVIPW